jgi:hypothetical protein
VDINLIELGRLTFVSSIQVLHLHRRDFASFSRSRRPKLFVAQSVMRHAERHRSAEQVRPLTPLPSAAAYDTERAPEVCVGMVGMAAHDEHSGAHGDVGGVAGAEAFVEF